MAVPTTRQEFIDNCLRRLGAPVIDINVDNAQVDDRVDEALAYYQDYHYDGSYRILYKHQLTASDITNEYVTLPQSIIAINKVLDIGLAIQSNSIFGLRYQLHLNDLWDISSSSYLDYYMALHHIASIEEIFVGQKPIRYNRHVNQLFIDMDWQYDVVAGHYVILDCYAVTDPSQYSDVWGDRFLLRYATALIKRQWGSNLIKFEGMQLPGAVTFNGQKLYDDAVAEIDKLEEDMILKYSLPVEDMVG